VTFCWLLIKEQISGIWQIEKDNNIPLHYDETKMIRWMFAETKPDLVKYVITTLQLKCNGHGLRMDKVTGWKDYQL